MNYLKSLAVIAVASILVAVAGAATTLPAALETAGAAVTGALVVAVVLAVIGAGVGGAGGRSQAKTPYW
ncbi:MAG: hypothetical protein ABEJ88_01090 [Halobacterium sp.]